MKSLLLIIVVMLIPILGYGVMHMLVYVFPMSEANTLTGLSITLAIIAIGLLVPYLMLKTSFFHSHLENPHQRNFRLGDIPKDHQRPIQSKRP